jgi:hypothetical protein
MVGCTGPRLRRRSKIVPEIENKNIKKALGCKKCHKPRLSSDDL